MNLFQPFDEESIDKIVKFLCIGIAVIFTILFVKEDFSSGLKQVKTTYNDASQIISDLEEKETAFDSEEFVYRYLILISEQQGATYVTIPQIKKMLTKEETNQISNMTELIEFNGFTTLEEIEQCKTEDYAKERFGEKQIQIFQAIVMNHQEELLQPKNQN
jgi:hypothetical protein